MLEVYAPITARPDGKVIGAYEIYADPNTLEHLISSRRHLLWAALAVVFLALYVALALLVRGASNFLRSQTERLRRRSRELLESYNRLEQSSLEAIKRHPVDGAEIVGKLSRLRPAVPLIRHHHERWDGNGYPDRLAGDTVPLEAYVVGLADAWDAMTTDRPYQHALGWDEAAEELRRGRGSQFSPEVVDAFFRVLRRRSLPGAAADLARAAG